MFISHVLFFALGFPVELSYKEWALRIDSSFEENFWIPEEQKAKEEQGEEAKLIHRRGIYKDTVGASHRFADYQLRPNLCVAMAVVRIISVLKIECEGTRLIHVLGFTNRADKR